jgi:hypothetical protein
MTTVNNADLARFQGVAVPRLPQAPTEYDPATQEQYSNVLRLYFNQINTIINQLGSGELIATAVKGVAKTPTVFTVSTLPSATSTNAGVRSFVSDATATTFASIVAGGGSNTVPIYCDGTNWRIG